MYTSLRRSSRSPQRRKEENSGNDSQSGAPSLRSTLRLLSTHLGPPSSGEDSGNKTIRSQNKLLIELARKKNAKLRRELEILKEENAEEQWMKARLESLRAENEELKQQAEDLWGQIMDAMRENSMLMEKVNDMRRYGARPLD